MKNYIYTKSSALVGIDTENLTNFTAVNSIYGNTDWMYLIDEDGTLIYDEQTKYDIKKGDIVFIMYPTTPRSKGYEREVIIVSNEKLYDYYKRYVKREESDPCCDGCPCGCVPDTAENIQTEA